MAREDNQDKNGSSFREMAPFLSIALIFLLVGFLLHPFYSRYAYPPDAIDEPARGEIQRLRKGKFTHPILGCEVVSDKKDIQEFEPLNALIQQQTQAALKEEKASKISVYFRGMTTGRWGGIRENDAYPGGSLVKIPFMIAYYKLAESRPEIFNEQLMYKGDFDESAGQITKPSHRIEAGKSYSIDELIYRMIVYSGNNSTVLLMRRMDIHYLSSVFGDLGVPGDQDVHRQWVVTTKTFSSFFRVLYNATYLSQALSERALELLSQTEFTDGLAAGVPPIVAVAHKFGEEAIRDTSGKTLSASLHDCGIIYHREHPYFLCIMTEGNSFEPLKEVIGRISKAIYTFVDSPSYPAPPAS